MPHHPWKNQNTTRRSGERTAIVALALAFLSVSWLPLSVRAWSAAWSAWHPASVGQLVLRTMPPVPKPVRTYWRTPWR